jgi:hypothetical protein
MATCKTCKRWTSRPVAGYCVPCAEQAAKAPARAQAPRSAEGLTFKESTTLRLLASRLSIQTEGKIDWESARSLIEKGLVRDARSHLYVTTAGMVALGGGERYPTLMRLVREGRVRIEGTEYVGLAADGAVVSVGNVGGERATEAYLSARPSPADW